MDKKKWVVELVIPFGIALVTPALVTFLWSLIRHEESIVDWQISFSLAITFGLTLIWLKLRQNKAKEGK